MTDPIWMPGVLAFLLFFGLGAVLLYLVVRGRRRRCTVAAVGTVQEDLPEEDYDSDGHYRRRYRRLVAYPYGGGGPIRSCRNIPGLSVSTGSRGRKSWFM